MKLSTAEWLKSGKYLPAALRDFHDQKDVFKAIDQTIHKDPHALVKRPDWVSAQCYVIDVFLWYMARRGYTLQKTRFQGELRDLGADVSACREARDAQSSAVFSEFVAGNKKEVTA